MPPPTKRRRTEPTVVEEISFDPASRQEYLTGFHKRKVQRAKQAQEAAEKRAREERIKDRRRLREERKADLERHVAEVNALLRPVVQADQDSEQSDSGEEWEGLESEEAEPIDHEAEYIDEDKYTTVTVEELDVSREGLSKTAQDHLEGVDGDKKKVGVNEVEEKLVKRKWTRDKPRDKSDKPKKKRKKFRYESKAERKFTRSKEHSKNKKQARERKAG